MVDLNSDSPQYARAIKDEEDLQPHESLENNGGSITKVKVEQDTGRRRDRASRSPRHGGRYSRSRSPPQRDSSRPTRRRRSRSSSSGADDKGLAHRSSRQRSRSRSPPRKNREIRKYSRSRSRSPGRGSNRDQPAVLHGRDRGRFGPGGPLGFGGYPPPHRPEDDFHPRNLPRGHPPPGPFGDPYHGLPLLGAEPHFGPFFEPFGGPGPYGRGPPPPMPPRGWNGPPQQRVPPGGSRGGGGGRNDRRRDEGPPGISLLVRNISQDITSEDLHLAFARIGIIKDVYIPRDYHSQQPKGFAFIEFATAEQAREARDEMDRFMVRGRQLEVVFAQERRKTPTEMRGRVVDGKAPKQGRDRDKGERLNKKEVRGNAENTSDANHR